MYLHSTYGLPMIELHCETADKMEHDLEFFEKKKWQSTLSGFNQAKEEFGLQGVHVLVKVHSGSGQCTLNMIQKN